VSINHPLAAYSTGDGVFTMKKLQYLFMSLAAMLLASPAFAQGAGNYSPASQWVPLAAGLGMALAAGLCGLGQGKATASATEALARNPGARPGIFIFLILGLAFIESLALFTFVIIFLKVQA
jgi:F-type H+-transporting ATPase subunit c